MIQNYFNVYALYIFYAFSFVVLVFSSCLLKLVAVKHFPYIWTTKMLQFEFFLYKKKIQLTVVIVHISFFFPTSMPNLAIFPYQFHKKYSIHILQPRSIPLFECAMG